MAQRKSVSDRIRWGYGTEQESNESITDSKTPEVIFSGGVYRASRPTYADGENAIAHFTSDGKLITDATLEVGDIEIGAVELKNSDSDVRANILAANTARTTATVVLATQDVDSNGLVHDLGTGAMAVSQPITLATDDTQYGAVGAASDVDGNVHGQLRYIGEAVDGLESSVPTPYANFKSPDDFSATYTSNVTITLAGTPATFTSDQISYIKYIPTGGSSSAVLVNGQNGVTLTISSNVITVNGAATPFASGDVYEVGINSQQKAFDASTNSNLSSQLNPVWSRYTDLEVYTVFTPVDVNYDEGAVISTAGYNTLNFYYSKTDSDADDTLIKVIYLATSDSAVDYQETTGTASAGVTTVLQNVYSRDKAALVEMISIKTNGCPYMRIDVAKAADAGTDSTLTTYINKAYL